METEDVLPVDSLGLDTDTVAADSGIAGDTISWSSRTFHYDAQKEKFSLYNSAVLNYKGANLRADTIFLDNKAQMVAAFGRPVIKDRDQPEIIGYRLKYNHSRQVGEIYYGTTRRDNQMFNGVEVRRQKTGEIHIARGDFSTCDHLEDQHFYFYCRRMVLEPNKKVMARPVVLNVSNVPVAVAPMLVIPLGKGRRSGFTRPKIGGDQSQGFYMRDLGYYWSMNDYMDLQLFGDLIEGERGTFDKTNVRGLYYYNKRDVLSGNLGGNAYISEFNPGNSGWEINFAHDQNLTPDGVQKLKGGGRFVSSRNVLGEALNEKEAVNQTANARLGYTNTLDWNKARLNISGVQDYNLTTGQQTRELPRASFAFGAPLFPIAENHYWDFESAEADEPPWFKQLYQEINYSYSGDFSIYTEKKPALGGAVAGDSNTYAGAKNVLGLSAKYPLLQYINVVPTINSQHYWNLHSSIASGGGPKADFMPSQGRIGDNVYKFNMGVSANTKLYGIAQPDLGRWEKIRHVVSPTIGYTYAPEIDTNRTFVAHPKFNTAAYQLRSKRVNLGLGNDVDIKIQSSDTAAGKPEPNGLKILATSSNISYDFEKEKRDGRGWSDISSTVRTEILQKHIPISVSMTHRPYNDYGPAGPENQVVTPILTAYSFNWRKDVSINGKMNSGLWEPAKDTTDTPEFTRLPWSAKVFYSFNYSAKRVSATTFQKTLTHSFSGSMNFNPSPKWEMSYNTNYNFTEGEFSKHSFEFNRVLHCWKMKFSWTPVGPASGWQFNIYVIDIPDIKLESAHTNLKKR
ncbi:putative LPS assembly protein LptD [Fibrobacterota bacterium]